MTPEERFDAERGQMHDMMMIAHAQGRPGMAASYGEQWARVEQQHRFDVVRDAAMSQWNSGSVELFEDFD
jgi:hypothetical protein